MSKRILVIEDNPTNLELMVYLLRAFGHQTLEARDGAEGVEYAARERPDLILCDVAMPRLDGFGVARALKSDARLSHIPLVAVTASAMVGDRDKVLAAGFDGYIAKPINPETFVAEVERYLTGAARPEKNPEAATILIADDRPENRSFLVSLLGYAGHRLLEAADGAQALALARAQRPDLIISDVLMPTMDGYEFVRELRADPALAMIPVIFTTAHYLDREAVALAKLCGVDAILPKPSEPETVLEIVAATLRQAGDQPPAPVSGAVFERRHSTLVRDKLREKTDDLRALNEKMTALIDLIQRAAMERDPRYLLEDFTHGARRIIGAQVAALFAPEGLNGDAHFFTSGLDAATATAFASHRAREGPLAVLLTHPGSLRLRPTNGDPRIVGLPPGLPLVRSVVAASVSSPTRTYGWICLTNKLGFEEFEEDDERLVSILAAQLGRMYENGTLYRELQKRTVELEQEIQERGRSEARFRSLIENTSDLISSVEADGRVSYASPSHERVLGLKPADFVGSDAFEKVLQEDRARVRGAFDRLVAVGGTVRLEFRYAHQDGSLRVVEAIATNRLDDPAIHALVVNSRDVTDRKRAEERTTLLLRVATAIGGALELEDIVEHVQREITQSLPCDFVVTLSRQAFGEPFRVVSRSGIPAHLHALTHTLEAMELGLGDRVAAGETIIVDPSESRDLLARFELDALIVAPLRSGGSDHGAVLAGRTPPGPPFAAEHVELCRGIASQLAVAIEATELYRNHREEAEVASAVARAGEELIAGLDNPALLDRVCSVTKAVLGCDLSWTVLRDAEGGHYTQVGAAGFTPEEALEMRLLRTPVAVLADLFAALATDGMTQRKIEQSPLARRLGCTASLYVPLRRGEDIIGVLVSGRRGEGEIFSATQERIARRLGHLASLALETARLIENLEQANRLKSDFVGAISHELRTPMNIIMGYNDLLRDGAFGPLSPEQKKVFLAMDRSARQLLELINATLDLSRLEAGRLPLSVEDVDVRELLATIREETSHMESPAVALSWKASRNLPRLRTDPVKVKMILKNLLQNGLKFTDAGKVQVEARSREGGIEFAVTDTGIGIPPEALPVIFEPFRQLEEASTRVHGGVGLGLYLVRRLTDLLGGRITVESKLGRGSCFRIWLRNLHDIAVTEPQ